MWSILKIVDKGRYLMALVPDHPKANVRGYVYHHIVVAENKIGHMLREDEVVHHKNEDKKDNRPTNLKVEKRDAHTAHHTRLGISMVKLICPVCATIFEREKRNTHLVKSTRFTTCSPGCRASMSKAIQDHGLTPGLRARIRANVIKEFIR